MKKIVSVALIAGLALGALYAVGCAQKAATPDEAIQQSQTLKSVPEKVNYLIGQAQGFYNSKEFQKAIETAQYVLSNLDADSQQAKNLIEKAKNELKAMAEKTAGDLKGKLLGK